jgi:glutamate formiminotransferase
MESYQCAQVSTNLTNFTVTGLYDAYRACTVEAGKQGLSVTGSELIGMIPEQALYRAGSAFLGEGEFSEDEVRTSAIKGLGLDSIGVFNVEERVLERRMAYFGLL